VTSAAVTPELAAFATRRRGLAAQAWRRFVRRPLAVAALGLLLVILVAGAFAPWLAPAGWDAIDLSLIHHAPELAGWHLFGTDAVGRDMFVRTLYGIRTTEEVALAAAALATLVGVLAGVVAGYYGGWVDAVVMRVADLVTAYPAVILTLAAIVYFRPVYPHTLILVFAGFTWAIVARVVRAQVASLRVVEFVEGARALGASDLRIMCRHL
jgi:peptide/nickel transport system permease protein